MNGYNFTERVRNVLRYAREEAVPLRHEYVGTEHILLGLLREGEGVGIVVLQNLGLDLNALRQDVIAMTKPGASHPVGPDLPYTGRAKKVLEFAMAEARELNHRYVGSEHLLLGLLREGRGIGGEALARAGLTIDSARHETLKILNSGHRPSPVNSMPSVGSARSWQTLEPWRVLAEPIKSIVRDAYERARAVGRTAPDTADLLAALILSSPEVAVALTTRHVEIDTLIAEVRRRSEELNQGS